MFILSGLSTCSDTTSFYTSVGWGLMQTALSFGDVDTFTRFFYPCSLTDKVSVSYTEYMGSIPIRGTFQLFVAVVF